MIFFLFSSKENLGCAVELTASALQETLVDFLDEEEYLAVDQNILPEPASLTSLAATRQRRKNLSLTDSDIMVAVSTGNGFKAIKNIQTMLTERID